MPNPLSIPPELKKVTQFIRRAEELDRDVKRPESRLVAYYCRQYAVKIGISLSKSNESTQCLGEMLTSLESEKDAMSVFSPEESRLICRNFAMEVFDKADAQDRAGTAGKGTAKIFYAAAVFLEILQHFADSTVNVDEDVAKTDSEVEEDKKRIYSKWKATEILKAIKEGREIVPGGYQDTSNDTNDSNDINNGSKVPEVKNEDTDDLGLNIPPMAPTSMPAPPDNTTTINDSKAKDKDDEPTNQGTEADLYGPVPDPPPPPYESTDLNVQNNEKDTNKDVSRPPIPPPMPPRPPSSAPPLQPPTPSTTSTSFLNRMKRNKSSSKQKMSKEIMADAVELTRFALAALEANDANLGATRLQQALEILSKR